MDGDAPFAGDGSLVVAPVSSRRVGDDGCRLAQVGLRDETGSLVGAGFVERLL